MLEIIRYTSEKKNAWDEFVKKSVNGTFLFYRDYMEYHSDRFTDYSLMIYRKNSLTALLPANRVKNTIYSHQGLTYGGLILDKKSKSIETKWIIEHLIVFFKVQGISEFYYKCIPPFYSLYPTYQIDYFLYQKGSEVYEKKMNLAMCLQQELQLSKSKLKHFRKTEIKAIEFREETDFTSFWNDVLIPRLALKHQAKPVHTLDEIRLLQRRFPQHIRQFSAYFENKIIAGVTIFETTHVVKSQYGATTEKGEKLRALDYLFIRLIQKYKEEGKAFFDMGVVNEKNRSDINEGLLQQKNELGCSVFTQDFYKLSIQ